jgi:hypothetical protein
MAADRTGPLVPPKAYRFVRLVLLRHVSIVV